MQSMKIWFDPLFLLYSVSNSHVGDAQIAGPCPKDDGSPDDCFNNDYATRPYYDARTYFPLDQKHEFRLAGHHLQLTSAFQMQVCDTSHWLICDPVEAGNIAVIDEEALSFLENFRVPTTLQEIVATRNTSIACLSRALFLFIGLGLLHDLDQEPVAHSEKAGISTLSAWLHITNACNLRCHYCYVSKSSDHMEKETSRRAVDAVIRSAVRHEHEHVYLKYAGGEAALQMPQVIATHDYAQQQAQEHNLQLSAGLLSNGTIMTQGMIEQLKERHIRVMISLDGVGMAHDQQRPYSNGARIVCYGRSHDLTFACE
jgi:uncharacterized protein